MFENKKAHYNFLFFSTPDEALNLSWETTNYRSFTPSQLLHSLQGICASFTSLENFEQIAQNFDSPEDMAEALCPKNASSPDFFFLLIFELWRHVAPEKRSVSVFCDELDHQIASYYRGGEEQEEEVLDTLEYLKQILDDNVDSGVQATDILPALQDACCHDIEAFLYDYILAQIEEKQYDLAAELLEGFYPYLTYPDWFDYLAIRLEMAHNPQHGHQHLLALIERVEDVQLALEILDFLAQTADPLFKILLPYTLALLNTEGDLLDLLQCCASYSEDAYFDSLIQQQSLKDPEAPLADHKSIEKKIREFFSDKN
ncbi:MAG: hypothetical protein JSS62_05975 [Verrucomicrobia bacterium]|nr:hypothetical protein [Verrucomicrobiota bacterium]MBS0647103.1 hypothetical protein [Verrucomicrobiota bacterium]